MTDYTKSYNGKQGKLTRLKKSWRIYWNSDQKTLTQRKFTSKDLIRQRFLSNKTTSLPVFKPTIVNSTIANSNNKKNFLALFSSQGYSQTSSKFDNWILRNPHLLDAQNKLEPLSEIVAKHLEILVNNLTIPDLLTVPLLPEIKEKAIKKIQQVLIDDPLLLLQPKLLIEKLQELSSNLSEVEQEVLNFFIGNYINSDLLNINIYPLHNLIPQLWTALHYQNTPNTIIDFQANSIKIATNFCAKALKLGLEHQGIYQGKVSADLIKKSLAQEILTELQQQEKLIFGGLLTSTAIEVEHFSKDWLHEILLYFNEILKQNKNVSIWDLDFITYQKDFEILYEQLENYRTEIHQNRNAYPPKKIKYQLDQYYQNFENQLRCNRDGTIAHTKKLKTQKDLEKHVSDFVITNLKKELYSTEQLGEHQVLIHTLSLNQILASYSALSKEQIIKKLITNSNLSGFKNLTISQINEHLKTGITEILQNFKDQKKQIQEPLNTSGKHGILPVKSNGLKTKTEKIIHYTADEQDLIQGLLPGTALLNKHSDLALHRKSGAFTRRILDALDAISNYSSKKINTTIAAGVARFEKHQTGKKIQSQNPIKQREISTHERVNERVERLFSFRSVHENWSAWLLSLNQTPDKAAYIIDKNDQQKIIDLIYAGLQESLKKIFYCDVNKIPALNSEGCVNFKDLVRQTVESQMDFSTSQHLAVSKKLIKNGGFAYLVLKKLKNQNIDIFNNPCQTLSDWLKILPVSKIWEDLIGLGLLKDPLFHKLALPKLFNHVNQELNNEVDEQYTPKEYVAKVRSLLIQALKVAETKTRGNFIAEPYECTLAKELAQFEFQIKNPETVTTTDLNLCFDSMLKKDNNFNFSTLNTNATPGQILNYQRDIQNIKSEKFNENPVKTTFSLMFKNYRNHLKNIRKKDKIQKQNIENLLQDNGKIKFPIQTNSVLKTQDFNKLLAAISAFGIAQGFQDPNYAKVLEQAAVLEILLLQTFKDPEILIDLQKQLEFLQTQFNLPQHILERLNFQASSLVLNIASTAIIDTLVDEGANYVARKILNLPFSSKNQKEIQNYLNNEEHKAYLETKKREEVYFGNALNQYQISKNFKFQNGFFVYLNHQLLQKYGLKLKNLNFDQFPLSDLLAEIIPKIEKCSDLIDNGAFTPLQVKKMMDTILQDFLPNLEDQLKKNSIELYHENILNKKNSTGNFDTKNIKKLEKKIKKRLKNNLFYSKTYLDDHGIEHQIELSLLLGAKISTKAFGIDLREILNQLLQNNKNYTEGQLFTLAYQKAQSDFAAYHKTIKSLSDQNQEELKKYSISAENISKTKLQIKNILRYIAVSDLASATLKNGLKAGLNLGVGLGTLNPVCILKGIIYTGATILSPFWYGLKFIGKKITFSDKIRINRHEKISDLHIKALKNIQTPKPIQKPSSLRKTTDLQSYYFSSDKELSNYLYKNFKKYYQKKTGNTNLKKRKIKEIISKFLAEKNITFPCLLPVDFFEQQNLNHYFFKPIAQKLMTPAFKNEQEWKKNPAENIKQAESNFLKTKRIKLTDHHNFATAYPKLNRLITKIIIPQPHSLIQELIGPRHETLEHTRKDKLINKIIQVTKIVDVPFYPIHWAVKKIIYKNYDHNTLDTYINKFLSTEIKHNNLFLNIALPLSIQELTILIQQEIKKDLGIHKNTTCEIDENTLNKKIRQTFIKICEQHPSVLNHGRLVENLHIKNKLYLENIFFNLPKKITDQSEIFNLLEDRFSIYCKKLSTADVNFNFLKNLTPEKLEEYRIEILKKIDFYSLQNDIGHLINNADYSKKTSLNIWKTRKTQSLQEILKDTYDKPELENNLLQKATTTPITVNKPKAKFLRSIYKKK